MQFAEDAHGDKKSSMLSRNYTCTMRRKFGLLTVLACVFMADKVGVAAPAWDSSPGPIKQVTVITDASLAGSARYGIRKLEAAIRDKDIGVAEGESQVGGSDLVLLAGLGKGHGAAASALAQLNVSLPTGPEALTVRAAARYHDKPAIVVAGSDDSGLMYAALDLADQVGWSMRGANPFQRARDVTETPYLRERGVVMFTMNRAYFESRLRDERFWARYLDMLARDRFNCLVLVFGYEDGGYMAPLYPYFFDVDGFPDVRVVGLTANQQARNLRAFKTMLHLAAERGIHVKPGIWEHIYRAGIQAGANSWASDGTKPTAGLVWGLNSQNLATYTVAALNKFHDVFPELTEVQFRMHEESGLRKDEIEPFWHDVFAFYRNSQPNVRLEFRAKGLPKSVIKDSQSLGLRIQLDTKIWMEQMGLPYNPTHINREDQNNARQSYADLLEYPQTYHMNWTLWNGGTTRELLWSDPDYARRLATSARLYDGQSLIVTEMQATKMAGQPHDAKPVNFLNEKYRYFDYEFERYWAFYRVFGRLSYNPQTEADVWEREYVARFGADAAPHVMKTVHLASRVLPRIVAASVPYSMFPTTTGWPEMMHLGPLPRYAQQEEGSDIAQFMNLRDEARSILQGTDTAMRRPEQTSHWFAQTSDAILAEADAAERAMGDSAKNNNEFKSTMTDARMLAALARYHSWRQLGGVSYNLHRQAGSLAAFDDAIADERMAVQSWHDLVNAAGDFYIDNMWFGPRGRNFPHHWKDEMEALDTEFDRLLSERRSSTARADARPVRIPDREANSRVPVVTVIDPTPAPAEPGKDLVVRVKVIAPAGVKRIRLRYRHVNQKEDYQTAEMTLDVPTSLYAATIPAAFIDPRWDLMYYVEIVDRQGNGQTYPDLEIETPYVVASVKR
jgi:hypothetical protein